MKPAVSPTGDPTSDRPRVTISNRADGGLFYWIGKLYGFAILVIFASLAFAALCIYGYFSIHAPPLPDLRQYSKVVPAVSRMYAADGTLLGEFAKEWRELVPFERIPKRLTDAFLAVEDHDFFAQTARMMPLK